MNKFEQAVQKATQEGHHLENDPPMMSSMSRHTCLLCGHAVLGNYSTVYGSATEAPCAKARRYKIGTSPDGKATITVDITFTAIPFAVWRDVGRLAGMSTTESDQEIFFFANPDNVGKAEEVLRGGLYSKDET